MLLIFVLCFEDSHIAVGADKITMFRRNMLTECRCVFITYLMFEATPVPVFPCDMHQSPIGIFRSKVAFVTAVRCSENRRDTKLYAETKQCDAV